MPARTALLPAVALAALAAACGLSHDACGLARAAARGGALPGAADPIPTKGPSLAASPDGAALEAWYERIFVGSYRRVGRRSPAWDADAEAFLRSSARRVLYGPKGAPVSDLLARGRTLRSAGCDDPLVLYLAAVAEDDSDSGARAGTELLERAVPAFHDVRYPRAVAFRAAEALRADYARIDEGVGKREALAPVERRWFLESLDDGSYDPDEDSVLVHGLARGELSVFFGANRAEIASAVATRGWIDPWLRLYISGEKAIDDAWDARGVRYANKVTGPGSQGFRESHAAARRDLTASWKARKDRPEAAGAMVEVAMAAPEPGESPRLWFDRSVSARLDYKPAYWSLMNALRTRWGGDPSALAGFARACAGTRRFDTVVPLMAFHAVEQAEDDRIEEARPVDPETDMLLPLPPSQRPPSLYRDSEVYDTVAAVLERYRREPAIDSEWVRYARLQAAVAFKAGRYEDARRFLRESGGELTAEARDAVGVSLLAARIEAYAGLDGPSLRRAEELFDAGQPGEAAPLFAAALARTEPAARPYVEERVAITAAEVELAAGRTIPFVPRPGLAGWNTQEGRWTVDPDGSLVGTSGARGLFIVAEARVGPDFEIEGDVEVVSTTNGQYQAGIVFGMAPSHASSRWSSFRWKKTAHEGEVVYFSRHFTAPVHVVPVKVPLRNHVVVRSWNGRLWAWLNGAEVVSDYAPEWHPPRRPDNQVGFGAYVDDNTFILRYRNVTLRRLTAPPPALR
jgi:hypothetical protein